MGWSKKWFYSVFGKLCFAENTNLRECYQQTQQLQIKMYVKMKFMRNNGLYLNMAKRCFV